MSFDWEPLPNFHVCCLQGVPLCGWIHDVAVWEPIAADGDAAVRRRPAEKPEQALVAELTADGFSVA